MRMRIQTIQDHNLGNRLQNYALQEVLVGMTGLEVETYRHWYDAGYAVFGHPALFRARKCLVGVYKRFVHDGRWLAFERFDREHVHYGGPIVGKELTRQVACEEKRDVVCVIGSDQVWNPEFGFTGEMEYAPFVPKKRKIAYAASFGVSEIKGQRARTASLLNDIAFVSVRERSGARIVHELTGRDVPVVLDPTMLIETDAWGPLMCMPRAVPGVLDNPFCLTYMLGTNGFYEDICLLCNDRGLAVIDLSSPGFAVGPAEFLWLVQNASLVCTDSYHAMVFSLLFHTPFAAFERGGAVEMSDRIATLDYDFDLACCQWGSASFDIHAQDDVFWRNVDGRLKRRREMSREWLTGALAGVLSGGRGV